MVYLLHGVTEARVVKVGAAPAHQLMFAQGRTAIVSQTNFDLSSQNLAPEILEQAALRHNALLQAYCADNTILPVRFGAVFSSQDAIQNHLDDPEAAAAQLRLLSHLDGCVEFGLQVLSRDIAPSTEVAPAAEGGRSFLARRATQRDARRNFGTRQQAFLHQLVSQFEAASKQQLSNPLKPGRMLDLSLLVRRLDAMTMDEIAAAAAAAAEPLALELRVTGPWPCYSFTNAPQSEESRNVS